MLMRSIYIVFIASVAFLVWQLGVSYQSGDTKSTNQAEILAPGWGELSFEPPAPATYQLPRIQKAASGHILSSAGQPVELADYLGDKVVLLSFIYTSCSDVNGCPLATFVLHALGKAVKSQPQFADDIRLVTLSFDPERDTPQVMRDYGKDFKADSAVEWVFATTESEQQLDPILEQYGQFVFKVTEGKGADKKVNFAHVLKSFLIDKQGYIRNIYSVSYLHPEVVLNDIITVLKESDIQS